MKKMLRSFFRLGCYSCKFLFSKQINSNINTLKHCRLRTVLVYQQRLNYSDFESIRPFDPFLEDEEDNDLDIRARTVISFNAEDIIINKLLNCASVNELFEILDSSKDNLQKEYLVQAILVLWHLQNAYLKAQAQMGSMRDHTESEYLKKLHELKPFKKFLNDVIIVADSLSVEELSCSILYLKKMQVDLKSNVMMSLLNAIEKCFKEDPNNCTLPVLSRYCVALKLEPDLWIQYQYLDLIPLIEKKMDIIETSEDLRLVTVCLMHMYRVAPKSTFDKYKSICEKFAENFENNEESVRSIVRVMSLLSFAFWSNENTSLVRRLALNLKNEVKKLEMKDLISLTRAFGTHLEPAYIAVEASAAIKAYIDTPRTIHDRDINIGVLSCASQLATYLDKPRLENFLYNELRTGYFSNSVTALFHILRSLKTSNKQLCDSFWLKTIENLQGNGKDITKIFKSCMRYMYFNNNMGGTYRHIGFERQMIRWISEEIEYGPTSYTPSQMARGVSFLLAYCRNPELVVSAIDRILVMKTQLRIADCVLISRGIEVMLELFKRKPIYPNILKKLVELDTCLNECSMRHLEDANLPLFELAAILRTYLNRRASPDSLLFHTIVQRLDNSHDQLSSRIIKDLSYSFLGLNCLIPSMIDKMTTYIVVNKESVLAEVAERVLTAAYTLGYQPSTADNFFKTCSSLLIRDKDRLSSLAIIQMCLALSFFHRFPPSLVSTIFSVSFLERIDAELATCYSKATYPVKVRYSLMELNRSVCIDLPELDVPWFHAKYCDEIATLDPVLVTPMHDDVRRHLTSILGDEKFIQTNAYSPYGYKINFLVLLDNKTNPLLKTEANKAKEKVAILLHSDQQFTNSVRHLKGHQQMRQRHLEMMGYRVIALAEHTWNAMYLTESHAKKSYLTEKLWPER